jgi:HEPN domain-containing protein
MAKSFMANYKWWLQIAESDLKLAEKGREEDFTLNVAIVHTQQCAEKAPP